MTSAKCRPTRSSFSQRSNMEISRPAHGLHLHAIALRERRTPVHHHVDFRGRVDRQNALLARGRDQRLVGRGIGRKCVGKAKGLGQRADTGPQKLPAAYDPVVRDSLRPGSKAERRGAGILGAKVSIAPLLVIASAPEFSGRVSSADQWINDRSPDSPELRPRLSRPPRPPGSPWWRLAGAPGSLRVRDRGYVP